MAKRKYNRKKTRKPKPSGFANMVRFIIVLLIIIIVLGYLSFRGWNKKQIQELESITATINTSMGAINYMILGEGPVILLSHMEGSGSDNAKLFTKLTNAGFKIICPSRPGYLQTPLSTNADFSYQSELFAELLHHLNINRKVIVMGISAGGPAAIEFARKYPDKCSDLILINSATDKVDNSSQIGEYLKITNIPFITDPSDINSWLGFYLAKYNTKNIVSSLLEAATMDTKSEIDKKVTVLMNQAETKTNLLSFLSSISPNSKRQPGLINDLENLSKYKIEDKRLRMPVLIIHSKTDKIIDFIHAEKLKENSRNAELYAYTGNGHAYWLNDDLDQITAKIIGFLSKASTPSTDTILTQNEKLYGITWVNKSDGALLQIMEDGKFSLDFPSVDSQKFIVGKVSIVDNQISFVYDTEIEYCQGIAGIYEFKLSEDQLMLKAINDDCRNREKHFTSGWFKI